MDLQIAGASSANADMKYTLSDTERGGFSEGREIIGGTERDRQCGRDQCIICSQGIDCSFI